ncbi:MAG: hypothetical protein IKX53_00695 [Bacteroidales bacterium]|nr:hypothetical protein [Bacteroidales bacterium]
MMLPRARFPVAGAPSTSHFAGSHQSIALASLVSRCRSASRGYIIGLIPVMPDLIGHLYLFLC